MWLVDVLVAAAVILVSAALCAPYPWRRRYPLPVLGLLLVAACAQLLLGAMVVLSDAAAASRNGRRKRC